MTKIDYTVEMQSLFLRIMISDHSTFVRVRNIFNSENFDKSLRPTAKFIVDFSEKYSSIPSPDQIEATTNVKLSVIEDLREADIDFCLDEFEKFTRRQELERAILKSADLLEKGDYDPVEKLIKDAVQISLTKDMGTDYFEDPRGRLSKLKDGNGQISTGWPGLDKKLYGGFNRGELNIFCAGSGGGKSLFLANLGVNWALQGLNVLYLTFELSEGLVSMRLDSMTTGIDSREIFKNLDDVELKVKMLGKRSGNIQVKYMSSGKNCNDVRAYLKEYQVRKGYKPDVLLIDYLDLMMPLSIKVSPSDLFVKDKYVSEEIRNLAMETQCVTVTASQLNRCLTLDTVVSVNGIDKKIGDISVGDRLLSNNGEVTVTEVMPITKQSVYTITTKSGKKIKCSDRHLFPTNNGLRNIQNGLSVGDKLHTNSLGRQAESSNGNFKET